MTTKWTSKSLSSGEANPASEAFGKQSVVLLLYGKNSFGDKIYSYLKITLNNLQLMKSAIQAGKGFTPSDFGEVIAAGKGDPTPEVRAEVASMYPVMDASKPAQTSAPIPEEKKNWDEY